MSEPIATWNRARGAWETPVLNLLCGHLEPFSRTWPKSGSMRNGSVFPRPVPGPAISAGASSSSPGLLPTPAAGNFNDGESLESWEARRQRNLAKGINGNGQGTPLAIAAQQLLPTPRASANENRQTRRTPSQEAGDHGLCLAAEVLELLPTPRVSGGSDIMKPPPSTLTGSHGLDLGPAIGALLPTPSVADAMGGHLSRSGDRSGELLLPGIVRELSAATRAPCDDRSEPSAG